MQRVCVGDRVFGGRRKVYRVAARHGTGTYVRITLRNTLTGRHFTKWALHLTPHHGYRVQRIVRKLLLPNGA